MAQRIAIGWILVLLSGLAAGCMPGGHAGPLTMQRDMQGRALARPADRSRPVPMESQQGQGVAARPPLRNHSEPFPSQRAAGSADESGGASAPMIPGERMAGGPIPVATASHLVPPAASGGQAAHCSLGDGSCEACAAAAARAGGQEIPLPTFRLPEMPGSADSPPAVAEAAATRPESTASIPVQVSNPGSAAGIPIVPPDGMAQSQPVRLAAAPAPEASAPTGGSSDVLPGEPGAPIAEVPRQCLNAEASNRRSQEETASVPPANTGEPLQVASTASSRATMQVRVVDDGSDQGALAAPNVNICPPRLFLPSAAVAATRVPASASAPVEVAVEAPARPQQTSPAVQTAPPSGLRVDPSLRNPWSGSGPAVPAPSGPTNPAQPSAGPSGEQPAARILPLSANESPTTGQSIFSPPQSDHQQAARSMPMIDGAVRLAAHEEVPGSSPAPAESAGRLVAATALASFNGSSFPGSRPSENPAGPPVMSGAQTSPAASGEQPRQLVARNAALTTEINGFGQYVPLADPALRTGQTVLVYCELDGYQSQRETDRDGDRFVTRLETRLTVTDARGQVVQETRYPPLTDQSRSQRRDFYLYVPFRPDRLQPGEYQLVLAIRDATAGSEVTSGPICMEIH